jgi:hypothetical protein
MRTKMRTKIKTKQNGRCSKYKQSRKNLHNRKLCNLKILTKSKYKAQNKRKFFNNTQNKNKPIYNKLSTILQQLYRLNIGSINSDFYILHNVTNISKYKFPGEVLILPQNTSLYKGIQYPKNIELFMKEQKDRLSWYGNLSTAHTYIQKKPPDREDFDMLEAKVIAFMTKTKLNLINITDHRNLNYILNLNKKHNKSPDKELFIALVSFCTNYQIDDKESEFLNNPKLIKKMNKSIQFIVKLKANPTQFVGEDEDILDVTLSGYKCNKKINKCYDFVNEHDNGTVEYFGTENKNSFLRISSRKQDNRLITMVKQLIKKENVNIHGIYSIPTINNGGFIFHSEICLFNSKDLSYDSINIFNKSSYYTNKTLISTEIRRKIIKVKDEHQKYYNKNLKGIYEGNEISLINEIKSIM